MNIPEPISTTAIKYLKLKIFSPRISHPNIPAKTGSANLIRNKPDRTSRLTIIYHRQYPIIDAMQIYINTNAENGVILPISAPKMKPVTVKTNPPKSCDIPVTISEELFFSALFPVKFEITVQIDARKIRISPIENQTAYNFFDRKVFFFHK